MKNKYLVLRGGVWHFDCKLPKRFGDSRVRSSLHTRDIIHARYVRDNYLTPVLVQAGAKEALEKIAAQIKAIDGSTEQQIKSLKANILKPVESFDLDKCFKKYSAYLNKTELREATIENYRSAIKSVIAIAGNKQVESLTKNDAVRTRDELLNSISARRLEFVFQSFKLFLKWCGKEGLSSNCLSENFNIPLPAPRTEHTPTIPAEKADECMACKKKWTLAPRIARYTGMRLREILRLTNKDIILQHGIKCFFVSEKSKTHESRIVPIADKLLPYIKNLSELRNTKKQFNDYNNKIKKIKGCEICKFHSWRVYANTQMMEQGVDRAVRMKILGHKDGKDIHTGYTSVQITQMKKAVDTIC